MLAASRRKSKLAVITGKTLWRPVKWRAFCIDQVAFNVSSHRDHHGKRCVDLFELLRQSIRKEAWTRTVTS